MYPLLFVFRLDAWTNSFFVPLLGCVAASTSAVHRLASHVYIHVHDYALMQPVLIYYSNPSAALSALLVTRSAGLAVTLLQ